MLTAHTCTADKGTVMADLAAARLPQDVVWIDLLSADPAEVAFVERATGLHVPTMVELSEIESSSRLRWKAAPSISARLWCFAPNRASRRRRRSASC